MLNFIKNIGLPELIIIGIILILLFGGRKVKELSRGLGQSSKELKKVKKEYQEAVSGESHEEAKKEEEADTQES